MVVVNFWMEVVVEALPSSQVPSELQEVSEAGWVDELPEISTKKGKKRFKRIVTLML